MRRQKKARNVDEHTTDYTWYKKKININEQRVTQRKIQEMTLGVSVCSVIHASNWRFTFKRVLGGVGRNPRLAVYHCDV